MLRHEVCSSALSPFPSSLKGHFPFLCSQAPQVLFVVLAQAWGCQAQVWHTEGQLHVNQSCPLLCSDLLVLMLDQTVFYFPRLVTGDLTHSSSSCPPFLFPCKSSLCCREPGGKGKVLPYFLLF